MEAFEGHSAAPEQVVAVITEDARPDPRIASLLGGTAKRVVWLTPELADAQGHNPLFGVAEGRMRVVRVLVNRTIVSWAGQERKEALMGGGARPERVVHRRDGSGCYTQTEGWEDAIARA